MNTEADHFKQSDTGEIYAGDHLLVEFWGAVALRDTVKIQAAVEAAGATLLHSYFHEFGDGGGVSGVSVLAESHITIHTWPERAYAAIDIFMCGDCDPNDCLAELQRTFKPERVETRSLRRGELREQVQEVA
jgi:S-adenosylmethionine decarboxylase